MRNHTIRALPIKNNNAVFGLISLIFCMNFGINSATGNETESQNKQLLNNAIALFQQQDIEALNAFSEIGSAISLSYQAEIWMHSDLDKAEDLIERAVELSPLTANNHFIRGRVMAKQANNSFFSAISYASKSLKSFQTAAELEPTNIEYRTGLMMFYLNAPRIAGGDKKEAARLLNTIRQIDKEQGALVELSVLRNSKKQVKKSDFDSLLKSYPEFASLDFQFAQWLQFNKEYDAVFAQYQLALQKTSGQNPGLQCDIQYQIGKTAILSETKLQYGL